MRELCLNYFGINKYVYIKCVNDYITLICYLKEDNK